MPTTTTTTKVGASANGGGYANVRVKRSNGTNGIGAREHTVAGNDSDSAASGHDNDNDNAHDNFNKDTISNSSNDESEDGGSPTAASPGRLPEEVYEKTLAWWRADVRRVLVKNLERESRWLAAVQQTVRTPWLDSYFLYSSSLGTHTFFMTALPAFFFFGYQEAGRGLVFVLGMGVYLSSFIKDLVCAPRPFAPPVTRLTIGSHHLEYGFPSTHSTNSVSVALFAFSRVSALALSPVQHTLSCLLLATYVSSIVLGRLYTGMHSLTDCAVGSLLGTLVWFVHERWWGAIEAWVIASQWSGPAAVVLATAVMVNQHPQPVDDCPCFEDAIAFVSVVAGILLAKWGVGRVGFEDAALVSRMAGSAWLDASTNSWADVGIWYSVALLKLLAGILTIFAWRLLAKTLLLAGLPPAFRALAHLFTLPHRRFYTPATEYARVKVTEERRVLLHPIPSVMDLPGELRGAGEEDWLARGEASGREARLFGGVSRRDLKARVVNGKGANGKKEGFHGDEKKSSGLRQSFSYGMDEEKERQADADIVKHYDADVITKVIVYSGIAVLASAIIPVTFEVLGWGVHP